MLKKNKVAMNFTCAGLHTLGQHGRFPNALADQEGLGQHEHLPNALADPEGLAWQVGRLLFLVEKTFLVACVQNLTVR